MKYVDSDFLKIDLNDLVALKIIHKNIKQAAKGGKIYLHNQFRFFN